MRHFSTLVFAVFCQVLLGFVGFCWKTQGNTGETQRKHRGNTGKHGEKRGNTRNHGETRLRSDGAHLQADEEWYVAGAVDPTWARLRSARLSDKSAAIYWQRFLLYVAWVDERHQGAEGQNAYATAAEYLNIEDLELYFAHLGNEPVIGSGGDKRPASSGWLDTVKRNLNSLCTCFVWPTLTEEDWVQFKRRLDNAKAGSLKGTQEQATLKRRGDAWVLDVTRPEGGYWVRKPQCTLSGILARLELWEAATQAVEYKLARGKHDAGERAKLQLKLAEHKQALLCCSLLLWTCSRTKDLRLLVVNWDIIAERTPTGEFRVCVEPVHDKTHWRQDTASQVADVGKVWFLEASGASGASDFSAGGCESLFIG